MEQTAGWQHETRCKEGLERHSTDLRFEGLLMRRAYYATKSGDCKNYVEEFLGNGHAQHVGNREGERMQQ